MNRWLGPWLLGTLLFVAAPSPAAPKARTTTPPKAPAPSAPAAPVAERPTAPSSASDLPTAALVARVAALYGGLEYDAVIPLAEEGLKRADLTLDSKLELYRLLGSAKAIVEDPVEAEKPFRLLFRARPDFEPAGDTPPKILAVIRKVQSEERALALQLREVERERIIAGLRLIDEPPKTAKGGHPLPLSFRLRDPTGAVETVRVPYRRRGTTDFSALALLRSPEGDWRGKIPAEFTSDPKGFQMEFYIETADAQAPLLQLGTGKAPLVLEVSPGTLEQARPPPVPRWAFFTSAGATVASGAAALGFGLALNFAQGALAAQLKSGAIDGADYARARADGQQLATATNASLIALGVTAVATAILAPLTNFSPETQ